MADAKLEIILNAKDQTKGAFSSVNKELSSLGGNVGKAGSALGGMAVKTAAVAAVVGGGLVAGLAGAVKSASSFEAALSEIQAVSGATGEELGQLRSLALQMGKDTSFSAKEAATGISELAKAGVSTADIMSGALAGSLDLAAAGGVSVGTAAEIASQAMNIFGLEGKDVAHVADLFAAGANKSATSVEDLGAAFNQSAAVAKLSGVSIEELTGTLSMFAQSGLNGSDAGTSLKTALIALQNPTDKAKNLMEDLGINVFDSQGKFVGLAGVADELKSALSGMSQEQRNAALATIFGSDAIRVAGILYDEGGDGVRKWTAAVDESGAASRNAVTRLDNLAGSFEQLKGGMETAAITVGSAFIPVLRRATDELSNLVDAFLESPDAQKAIQDLATNAARALDTIIAKLKDPAFQNEMREWGQTALAAGKAVVTLAGDVAQTLGPPLQAAAGWFRSLDEDGRKNVVMFGLVAGGAIAFRDELKTLLVVGNSVIDMFIRKAAEKAKLTGANQTLAGSAGKTAAAFGAVRAGAAVAAPAIGVMAGVTLAAGAAALGTVAALNAYDDANGGATRGAAAFAAQMDVNAFAIAHGATMLNNHGAAFTQFISANQLATTTTEEMAVAWNLYLGAMQGSMNSIAGLTPALTSQMQAQQAVNQVLGEGLVAGTQFNDTMGMMGGAARALAATLPPVGSGMAGAALAAADLAVPVQASALALQEMNSYGSPAQMRLNEIASAAVGLSAEVQRLNTELGYVATSFSHNATEMQGLSGEAGQLGGWLGTLQGEWDALDAATKKQGFTTAEQAKRYAELAPLIQYLNAESGKLKGEFVGLTEAQVRNWQTMQQLGSAIAEGGAKAAGAGAAMGIFKNATDGAGTAAKTGAGAISGVDGAARDAAKGAAVAAGAMAGLSMAIKAVPKSFTVTANVDISGALANIQTLSNSIPRSPAKEGPFRKLPNWHAIYEGLAPAGEWAISTLQGTTGAMAGALKAAVDDGSKAAAEVASAVAKAVGDVLGATKALAGFDFAADSPTGEDMGFFTHLTTSLLKTLETAAAGFEDKALEHTGKFADAVGKVGSGVKNAVDGLMALGKANWATSSPTGSAIGWFVHLSSSLVQSFADAAEAFEDDALKAAGDFADAAGKVGGSVANALKGLQELAKADWAESSPSGSAMGWFTHLIASLVQNFATAAKGFGGDALAAASEFADAAGKVGGAVGNAMAGLKALATADWAETSPSGSAMAWFTHLIAALTANFATAAKDFDEGALGAASAFADSAGKVVATIGPAVEGFAAMATMAAPSEGAIDSLMAGVRRIVGRFAGMAAEMDAEGIKATGDFASAAGTALGAAKTGVELFAAMAGDKDKAGNNVPLMPPSAQAIDNLMHAIRYVIAKFREMASQMESEGIAQMQTFATASGQVLGAAKAGTDLFKGMENLAVPAKESIDYLLGNIGYVISQTRAIATGIGTEGLKEAQAFATGSLTVITTIKNTLEMFKQIDAVKDIPAKILEELHTALEGALDFAHKNFLRAEAIKSEAQAFLKSMQDAFHAFTQAQSLANSMGAMEIAAPAGVGGGASGGGSGGGGTTNVTNLSINGDIYDGARFEDRVVSALAISDRRGR